MFSLSLAVAALRALGRITLASRMHSQRSIAGGVFATVLAIVLGFLINRNIFNSDNYRYLALLLIPWSLGFGLALQQAAIRPGKTRMRASPARHLRAACSPATPPRGIVDWVGFDDRDRPVRQQLDDPLRRLQRHPGVRAVFGGYWDVYRLSFLTGGVVKGCSLLVLSRPVSRAGGRNAGQAP